MSELLDKQFLFSRSVAKLLDRAHELGYEVALGEALRTPEMAKIYAAQGKGTLNSLHILKLAIDLNLFRNGKYLDKSEDHAPLGAFWKSLGPLHSWGGDFRPRPDGNHYSISHEGRK